MRVLLVCMHVHTFILITLVLCGVFYSIYLYYGNNIVLQHL